MSAKSDLSKSTALVASYAGAASRLGPSSNAVERGGFQIDSWGAVGYLNQFSHQLANTQSAVPPSYYEVENLEGITQGFVCPSQDYLTKLKLTVDTNPNLSTKKKQEIKQAIQDTKKALNK